MSKKQIKAVRNWFKTHIQDENKPYLLDPNQAAIVLDAHKNCLVTARAGSGKTRTVVAKIIYLVAHDGVKPEEIIVFAFNRKARAEINDRLQKILFDGQPLLQNSKPLTENSAETKTSESSAKNSTKVQKPLFIATTFHAFAFHLLDDSSLKNRLITEDFQTKLLTAIIKRLKISSQSSSPETNSELKAQVTEKEVQTAAQFIARSEQLYFEDYEKLYQKIDSEDLIFLAHILKIYRFYLEKHDLLDFNDLLVLASKKLNSPTSYRYIFIDEYQDFSKLFLCLIQALRKTCPASHLLAVGDDWQAINGFAGSDVRYFKNFERYFPEDSAKLFIPTNYRSGKRIVKCANYFMAASLYDFQDCKTGNKLTAHIHLVDLKKVNLPLNRPPKLPLSISQTFSVLEKIVRLHSGQTVKILSRNNTLNTSGWSLEIFYKKFIAYAKNINTSKISYSTIHRSKGLEADVVVLLEIDAGTFPKPPKPDPITSIFGETPETRLDEEKRLFYVALTRPKKDLYIFTTTPPNNQKFDLKNPNFLTLLNPNWLDEFEA